MAKIFDDPDNNPAYDDEGNYDPDYYVIPPGFMEIWDKVAEANLPTKVAKGGLFSQCAQNLFKAKKGEAKAGHKYIARYPTGNPKRPWRYVYKLGEGRVPKQEELDEGLRVKHPEEDGHFHVKKVDGEDVHVEHKGEKKVMKRKELHDLIVKMNKPALEKRRQKLIERVEEAHRVGATEGFRKLMEHNLRRFEESNPFLGSPWSFTAHEGGIGMDETEQWEPPQKSALRVHAEYLPEKQYEVPRDIMVFPNGDMEKGIVGLFEHQVEGVSRIQDGLNTNGGFLLMDEPGLGKTTTAVAAMVANGGKRNLIIVPTNGKENLKANWSETSELYNIDVVDGAPEAGNQEGTFILSYDELADENGNLREELLAGFDMVVFDESHNMANADTDAARLGKELQDVCEKALYLSATPFSKASDMHYMTKLGLFKDSEDFARFVLSVGGKTHVDRETGELRVSDSTSPDVLARLAAIMHVDGFALRHNADLTGRNDQFSTVNAAETATAEQMDAFHKVDQIMDLVHAHGGLVDNNVYGIAAMMQSSWHRQWYESLKVPQAVEIAKQAIAEGKQVSIFSSYVNQSHNHIDAIARQFSNEAAQASGARKAQLESVAAEIQQIRDSLPEPENAVAKLVEALGGSDVVAQIHGGANTNAVDEQKAYQSGQKKIMVGSVDKAGTGLSFHDTTGEAPRVQINMSTPWGSTGFMQLEGRSHRLGSKSDTQMHWLIGDSAQEKRAAGVIKSRLETFGAITQGDVDAVSSTAELTAWEYGDIRQSDAVEAANEGSRGDELRSRFAQYAEHRMQEREASGAGPAFASGADRAHDRAKLGFEQVLGRPVRENEDGTVTISNISSRQAQAVAKQGATYNKADGTLTMDRPQFASYASASGLFSTDAARFHVGSAAERNRIQNSARSRVKSIGGFTLTPKELQQKVPGAIPAGMNIPDDHFLISPNGADGKRINSLYNALEATFADQQKGIVNPNHPKQRKQAFYVVSPAQMHLLNDLIDRAKASEAKKGLGKVKKALSSERLAEIAQKALNANAILNQREMYELAPPGMTVKEYQHRKKVRSLSEQIKRRHKTRKKRR